MRAAQKYFIAVLAGLSLAGIASQVSVKAQAQNEAQRDQAIHRCIMQVQAQYPSTTGSGDVQRNRVSAYKACMTEAGFRP